MKTQINNLRSGTKNQFLNDKIDYSKLPKSTSHNGHAGTNNNEAGEVWQRVISENPEELKVKILDEEYTLTANRSISGKSVNYTTGLTDEQLRKFFITPSKTKIGSLQIDFSTVIEVRNGQKSYTHLCPSLIEIL